MKCLGQRPLFGDFCLAAIQRGKMLFDQRNRFLPVARHIKAQKPIEALANEGD